MIQCRLTVLDRVTSSAYMYMYNYIQVIYKPNLNKVANLSPEDVGMVLNTEFYWSVLHQVVNFVHKKWSSTNTFEAYPATCTFTCTCTEAE